MNPFKEKRGLQLSLPLLQHLFTALQTLLPTQLAGQGVLSDFSGQRWGESWLTMATPWVKPWIMT
jgi:hypothetical protein